MLNMSMKPGNEANYSGETSLYVIGRWTQKWTFLIMMEMCALFGPIGLTAPSLRQRSVHRN